MKINNIDFDIKEVNIEKKHDYTFFAGKPRFFPQVETIKITAETENRNLLALDKWFSLLSATSAKTYKFDIIYNSVQIYGIFPVDYTFNQFGINVQFSADYISGNMELFNKQKLRKEKLKEIQKKYDSSK